ncbi:hypothetical protein HPP92_018037 [Vanilla planifolia]|uniref:C2H2-type domain-containing protein n=1 Tax=Vanilla planifolia TaxID=51239 RepID=A0A835QAD7_VANPL|nr:hypothetical protein HPP92_018037 [Vanilla planifolia]
MKNDGEPQKHRCRLCRRSFSCGRSLGGHMRSHMHSYASNTAEKEQLGGLEPGYGLRENPKKTWRLSAFVEEAPPSSSRPGMYCKDCGKGFASWKALFGHMRCHSDRIRRQSRDEQERDRREDEEEGEGWWGEQKVLLESTSPRSQKGVFSSSSSSITEHDAELEEVALSLMMLSRDAGGFREPAFEPSDKRSVVLAENELKRSESKDGDVSQSPKSKKKASFDDNSNVLDSREDKCGGDGRRKCTTCMKTFHSYQALGGHRASHKRIRGCCFPLNASFEDGDAFGQTSAVIDDSRSGPSKKSRIHECCICGKRFSSGQALGGHKRSHLLVSNQAAVAAKAPELIDLNLPAPIDDESSMSNPSPILE